MDLYMARSTTTTRAIEAQDRHITLNGLRLHYRDWGDAQAPPLVLIHGSGLTARAYDGLASGLAPLLAR